jgi:peptidoglycan/xylan/chitin deacetylase (PgdA/CDA1 family)
VPSWPAVVVGAVVVGALLGAAQKADVDPGGALGPAVAPPVETPPAVLEGASESTWPPQVRTTLPAQRAPQQAPQQAPRVALTFDDGPHPEWTPRLLDVLARHDASATFCVVGEQIAASSDVLRRIHSEGHALCNHTAGHDYGLPARSPETIRDEIATVSDQIAQLVPDAEVTAFRAPGGRFTPEVVDAAAGLGLMPWAWSVDPMDWRTTETDAIVSSVLDAVAPDAVILLHDGGGDRSATVAAVAEIVPVLQSVGYEFVTLPITS